MADVTTAEVLHDLIDAASGRKNMNQARADELHTAVRKENGEPLVTDAEVDAAANADPAVAQALEDAKARARGKSADNVPEPVSVGGSEESGF